MYDVLFYIDFMRASKFRVVEALSMFVWNFSRILDDARSNSQRG